jgi:hypothetical protein
MPPIVGGQLLQNLPNADPAFSSERRRVLERLNPNVLGILRNYFDYIERLRKEGVARKAIYFERRDRLRR